MGLPIDPSNGKVIVQGYVPSLGLSAVGIAVFGLLGAIFTFHWLRNGRQRYMLWITLGSLFMALGFAVRIPYHFNPTSIPIYSVTQLIILLSPCAFIAQDYYTLPHVATTLGLDDCLLLSPRIIGRTFLISDGITFFIQLSGSGMTAVQSLAQTGSIICMVGLIAQCVSFVLFSCLLFYFGFQARRRHPDKWTSVPISSSGRFVKLSLLEDWRTVWWAMCWTTIGIMVRCVFRVIEFAQGYDGYLRVTEGYFYCLDSLPLALAIAVWVFVWPPKILAAAEEYAHSTAMPLRQVDKSPSGSVGSEHILYPKAANPPI